MSTLRRTFLTALSVGVSLAMFSLAAPVHATGTFYVDSVTGNDANDCLSADAACLTVAGAKALITVLPDPSNTTLKLNGTFTDQINFAKTDVTLPDTLDGLHITATDENNLPSINTAIADVTSVMLTSINHVTVDHLSITGGPLGIYVTGSSTAYATDVNIHHNTVSGISDEYSSTGIEALYVKKSSVHHNTVSNVAMAFTDVGSYTYGYGLYLGYSDELAVHNNTVTAFGISDTFTAAGSHTNNVYGMYTNYLSNSTIHDNTISDIYATEVSSAADTTHSLAVYGLYGLYFTDTVVENNSLTNITATVDADVDGNRGSVYSYGIFISDIRTDDDSAIVQNNTIDTVTTTNESDGGAAYSYGISFQYAYNATVTNNTINNITGTFTTVGTDVSTNVSATGIHGPYFGTGATVSQNTISNLTASTNYSGDDSVGNPTVRGIYVYGAQATVTDNNIQGLSRVVTNNAANAYYDIGSNYGIDVNVGTGSIIKNNKISDITDSYVSTGTNGVTYFYNGGISVSSSDNIVVQNNTIKNLSYSTSFTDSTDTSTSAISTYGIYLSRVSGATINKNKIKRITVVGNAGNSNSLTNAVYGMYAYGVTGTISNNRMVNASVSTSVVDGGISQSYNGIYLNTSAETAVVQGNIIRDISVTGSGETSVTTTAGVQVGNGQHVIISGNQIRPVTAGSLTGTFSNYGIAFTGDASQSRLLNNIALGMSDFTGTTQVGVWLPSQSTLDIDMIHNTLANWKYPIQVDGGSKVYLRNNILAAVGADSYAIAVGRDEVNNDTFKSDYNLLYNATAADQLVYDTDNTIAIALADWTNVGGSYGYDVHSLNKAPRLTATGLLKKQSKARNAGSKDYPYDKTDVEYGLLQTDVNGDNRPITQTAKQAVDIGADEYHK